MDPFLYRRRRERGFGRYLGHSETPDGPCEAGKEEAKAAEHSPIETLRTTSPLPMKLKRMKPQNRLRELREKAARTEYLRYHILASETAICS